MKKHFVEFYSPGTFLAEITVKSIESWNIDKAKEMAKDIKERYSAIPYGFRFVTKDQKSNNEIVNKSGMYYFGGTVKTLKELKQENNSDNKILIKNIESADYNKIVINSNSYKWVRPFRKEDTLLKMNT